MLKEYNPNQLICLVSESRLWHSSQLEIKSLITIICYEQGVF